MDDKLILLMKFGELENLHKLQKGQVYCKNLKFYSKLEKKNNDTARGDSLEGKYRMTACSIKVYNRETGNLEFSFDNADSSLVFNEVMEMPVFCMTGVSTKYIDLKEKDENTLTADVKFSNILSKMLEEGYWQSALIITNQTEFLNRILNKCSELGIELKKKLIKYTDMDINLVDRYEDIDKDITNIAYWKDNAYSYQYEYRLAMKNCYTEDDFILDIGDITDISKLYNQDELKEFLEANLELVIKSRKEML